MRLLPAQQFIQSTLALLNIRGHVLIEDPEFCPFRQIHCLSVGVGVGKGLAQTVPTGFQSAVGIRPIHRDLEFISVLDFPGFPGGDLHIIVLCAGLFQQFPDGFGIKFSQMGTQEANLMGAAKIAPGHGQDPVSSPVRASSLCSLRCMEENGAPVLLMK